jgi:hypothetical protein
MLSWVGIVERRDHSRHLSERRGEDYGNTGTVPSGSVAAITGRDYDKQPVCRGPMDASSKVIAWRMELRCGELVLDVRQWPNKAGRAKMSLPEKWWLPGAKL